MNPWEMNWSAAPAAASPMDAALAAEGVTGPVADFARSIYKQESSSGKNTKTSNAGAVGGMQILPGTFAGVADKDWSINDPTQNARAGIRYAKQMLDAAGGDPALAAAGYYGGPGGLEKARRGVAVSDPRNPNAPNTLQYGQQVAARLAPQKGLIQRGVEAVIPSAEAAPVAAEPKPWEQKWDAPATTAPGIAGNSTGGAQGTWAPEQPQISRSERFMKGLRDPIDGGAQLLTKILPEGLVNAGNQANNFLADKTGLVARLPEGGVDQQVREQEAAYQAKRGKDAGFDGYRVLGNVASPANAALAMRAPAAATLAGRVGTSAAIGAGSAGMAPVTNGDNFLAEKAKQVGLGAAFGGAAPVVTGAIGRLISPNASVNPLLQLLQREGVRPTIGQTLGGVANRMEERAMSVPIVGDAIANARGVATRQLNEAALNRATGPIGVRTQGAGQGAVQQAGNDLGSAYDAARNALGSFRLDQQATRDVQQLRNMAAQLPDRERAAFERVWDSISTDISPNGTIPAAVFKRIDSKLGSEAARFSKSGDAYQQSLGQALEELQNAISNAGRRANPRADAMFRAADEGYANLVRVEGASKAAHNAEGVFSPAQLNAAIRQADQSVRGRSVSRGTALMQDLGNAGQQVLGNRVPNSGTADRLMQLGAGGALVSNPLLTLGGGAAGMAMYTQPMQALLRGAVTARPQSAQAVRNALLEASTRLSPGAAQIGIGLAE